MSQRTNETWACGRCGVKTSFAPGADQPAEPIGWAFADGEWRCLSCRRNEVIETATTGNAPLVHLFNAQMIVTKL